jgi:uncharacterized membrane protein (DUF2068 family)
MSGSVKASEHGRHAQVLRAVASIELMKGVAVFVAGIIILFLVHKDPWDIADDILHFLRVNPDRHFAQMLLNWADTITDSKLWWVAGFAFGYSALRFVEAYGLWKARIWAEWVALISGALYLPLELRAIHHRPSAFHFAVLLINLAVIFYMAYLRATSNRRATEP